MNCHNCKNSYNRGTHAPRVLQCGHTHCHFCISTLLSGNEVICVVCEFKQAANSLTDIPLNYSILDCSQEETQNSASSKDDLCLYHNRNVRSFCKKCKEFTCVDCFPELHKTEFDCSEISLADGIESLITGSKNALSNLREAYEANKNEFVTSRLEHTKKIEVAFEQCLWSIRKERQYLEIQQQKMEDTLFEIDIHQQHYERCRSPKEYFDIGKKISALIKWDNSTERLANLELFPSSDILWRNLPTVTHFFQDLLKRSRARSLYAIQSNFACPITFADDGAWIALDSTLPADKIPEKDAFTFKINTFQDFLGHALRSAAMTFNIEKVQVLKDPYYSYVQPTITLFKISIEFDFDEKVSDENLGYFFDMGLKRKIRELQYTCHLNNHNLLYFHKLQSNLSFHIRTYVNNMAKDVSGNVLKDNTVGIDLNECILLSNLSANKPRKSSTEDSIELDVSRGCPILAMKDAAQNFCCVIMKIPIKYAGKEFKILGYCKDGIQSIDELIEINSSLDMKSRNNMDCNISYKTQDWLTYLKLC